MDEKIKEIEERIIKLLEMSETSDVLPSPLRALPTSSSEWRQLKAAVIANLIVFPLLFHISTQEKKIEELIKERLLCPECLQMLEPDGSCFTCRFAKKVKELEEEIKELESLRLKY